MRNKIVANRNSLIVGKEDVLVINSPNKIVGLPLNVQHFNLSNEELLKLQQEQKERNAKLSISDIFSMAKKSIGKDSIFFVLVEDIVNPKGSLAKSIQEAEALGHKGISAFDYAYKPYLEMAKKMPPHLGNGFIDAYAFIHSVVAKTQVEVEFKEKLMEALETSDKQVLLVAPRCLLDTVLIDELCNHSNYAGALVQDLKDESSHIKTLSRQKGKMLIGINNVEKYKRIANHTVGVVDDNHFTGDSSKINIIFSPANSDFECAQETAEVLAVREQLVSNFSAYSATSVDGQELILAGTTASGDDDFEMNGYYKGIGLYRTEFGLSPEEGITKCLKSKFSDFKKVQSEHGRGTVMDRLSDITSDKSVVNNKHESVRYLLNINDGRKLLVRDLLTDLILSGAKQFTPNVFESGLINILIPNVQNVEEVKEVKKVLEYCKSALKGLAYDANDELTGYIQDFIAEARGVNIGGAVTIPKNGPIPFDANIRVGCMIENPFALRDIDSLREQVNSYTVGMNDMTWYHHVLLKLNPEYFEDRKFSVQEGEDLFAPVLKADVGSKRIVDGQLESVLVGTQTETLVLRAFLLEKGVIDKVGNVLMDYKEISNLDLDLEEGIEGRIKTLLLRLTIDVDSLPGRDRTEFNEPKLAYNPRILSAMAYSINLFNKLTKTDPGKAKYIGSCGDVDAELLPFLVGSGLPKLSVYTRDIGYIKFYLRNLNAGECRAMLPQLLGAKDALAAYKILSKRHEKFNSVFQHDQLPLQLREQLISCKRDKVLMDESIELSKKYLAKFREMNENNYNEILREVFGNESNVSSLKEACYIFQRNAFKGILGVSRIRAYDILRNNGKTYIRTLSSPMDGSSEFNGRLIADGKLQLKNYFTKQVLFGEDENKYELVETDLLSDSDSSYAMLPIYVDAIGAVDEEKRVNVLIKGDKVYFELTEGSFHKQCINGLNPQTEPAGNSRIFEENGYRKIGYYSPEITRDTLIVERNLLHEKMKELRMALNDDNKFEKLVPIIFGEKIILETHREGIEDLTKEPKRQVVVFADNAGTNIDKLIQAAVDGKAIFVLKGVCYIDNEPLDYMDASEELFKTKMNQLIIVRDEVNNKVGELNKTEMEELKQKAEADIVGEYE